MFDQIQRRRQVFGTLKSAAMQPDVDYDARDPKLWRSPEVNPSPIMFAQHDRNEYSEPRVVKELLGVTIWEAWNVSVSMPDRRSRDPLMIDVDQVKR